MRKERAVIRRLVANLQMFSVTLFLFVVCALHAQVGGTGSIQGTVTDATGAVIPNASVTLTEESTQVKRTTQTDGSGVYVFPNIKIGTYTTAVTAAGFERYTKTGNVLEVGRSISVNVKMTVGQTTQGIEVKADALALQTEDVSFKQTVDQQDITEMPLNSVSRQITGLLAISGGVNSAPGGDFTGNKYTYQAIAISIAGGQGNTTMWRLDGGDNNDYMGNSNLPFPFPDAVAEFSVESTVLGAQDGMHSGGLVNAVTRSGTNTYHGSAFEFIRNNYLDATNFFSSCTPVAPATTCTAKDTLHQNQYGGTFGGKILRDRLFAFAGYQHLKNDQSTSATQATVPTAANLAGDFSTTDPLPGTPITGTSCVTTASKEIQLHDPLSGAILPGNKYPTTPTYNAQALALLKYLPPINPAYDTGNCGYVSYAIPSQVGDNEFVTRVDYTINSKNHLYGRYFIDGYQSPPFFFPTNILVTTASGNLERVQTFTLGEDYAMSNNLVNSAHISILRRRNNRGFAPDDINAATLGVNLYQTHPNGLYLSTGKFTVGCGTCAVANFNDNTLAIDDEVTLIRSKHQIVFGGEFVRNQLNISNATNSNGFFSFNGEFSANGPSGGTSTADGNLDFLKGAMSGFNQSSQQQNALRAPIPCLYGQDTFHATKRLTLIAGIRWSPEYMPVDVFNRGSVFNYNAFVANQVSTVYPNAPAGTFFYGDPGVPREFTKNSPWQFSPNLGLAYDPFGEGKTVFRAGAELIYDEVNFFTGERTNQNPPFAPSINQTLTTTSGPLSFSSPWSVGAITTSPFPIPAVPSPSQAAFFPQSSYIVLPTQFHAAYTTQWTASIQQQFGRGWQLQIDYIGNKTTHLPLGVPLSPAVFIPSVWGAGGTGCTGVVLTGPAAQKPGAAGTPCSTTANQAQRFALTVANPVQGNQYQGGASGTVVAGYGNKANYNGLVATVQHRLSSSFSLLANYTWSKCLNEADATGEVAGTGVENPSNPSADYGPCGSDYRHVANIVLITRSNFHLPRYAGLLLNGWEFAPLAHIISGAPFNVTAGQDNSYTDVGNDRPNLVVGVPVYIHIANRSGTGSANRAYLNPAAFAQICPTGATPLTCSAYGTYGNIGRNSFRSLPNYQFDAQVSRIFPIHERLNLTLRLEGFNVLNHPNFATPSAGLTSSTFGQISSTANSARVFQGSAKVNF
jgi:carboxypeptidase family protein